MRNALLRLLLATAVLGLALPGFPLARGGDSPVISLSGTGPVWISGRVASPDGPLGAVFHVEFEGEGGVGISAYHNGRFWEEGTAPVTWAHPGVLVEAGEHNLLGVPVVGFNATTGPDVPGSIEANFPMPAGDESFVAWAAGHVASWTLQVTGPSDASVVALEQGASAYYFGPRDLRGPLNVGVTQDVTAPALPTDPFTGPLSTQVMARASASASASIVIQRGLIGDFTKLGQSGDVLSVFGPSGGYVGCPCSWAGDPTDTTPNGPGAWAFEDTGAGAGNWDTTQTYVLVADAPVLRG